MKYTVTAYLTAFGFVVLSTVISEFAQIVSHRYDKPLIIRYINDSANIFALIIPLIWLCTSSMVRKKVEKDRKILWNKKKRKPRCTSPTPIVQPYCLSDPLGMGAGAGANSKDLNLNESMINYTESPLSSHSLVSASQQSLDSQNIASQVSIGFSKSNSLLNKSNKQIFKKKAIKSIKTVKLCIFHPNPSCYRSYKESLNFTQETIIISLVKSEIFKFLPFIIIVSWLYSGGGMLWYLSLTGTTIPTNTCLARFRALFVFFLSAIFFGEIINLWKIIGIFFAFCGVATFAYEIESNHDQSVNKSQETSDTLWGCILILLAALFSALGDVIYRIGSHKCFNNSLSLILTFLFNGCYGIVILTTFWFIFYIETFIMPQREDILLICGVSLILMISNVIQYLSITLTTPFFVNVCLFLKIPLSFIIDVFIHHYHITYLSITGGCCVLIGFLMLEVINPPKWCCKNILLNAWCSKEIQKVRKRTVSFNIDN